MSERTGQNCRPGQLRSGQPPEVSWNSSEARNHACNVLNATSGANEIILNFGTTQGGNEQGKELAVQLLQRIRLRPLTAKNLRDMLRSLIAEVDAKKPGIKP